MRIGPLEIRRRTVAAADNTQQPAAHLVELGRSGTVDLHGFLYSHEYNPDLVWPRDLHVYERMQRSDASVQESLEHIFSPVRNATWNIEPASQEPLDLEIAEMVRRAYFKWLNQSWLELLDQTLDYLVFGHQVFEVVEQVVTDSLEFDIPVKAKPATAAAGAPGEPAEQGRVRRPPRQFLTFDYFAPRAQHTLWKWNLDGSKLVSVTQRVFKDGNWQIVELPAENLIVFTNKKRGDDFRGRSILRTAYKPWTFKELIEKVDAIAVERHGVGVWLCYPPEQADNDSATLTKVEQILSSVRSGAFSYILSPGPKQTPQNPNGWIWEIATPQGGLPDMVPRLNYHRAEIKAAVLARFAELGHQQTGARATGDTQSTVWFDAIHAVARYIADVHRGRIERLVRVNYPAATRFPEFDVSDIESKDILQFGQANAQLVAAGAIVPDRSYRSFVRQTIDAPDEDDPDAADAVAIGPPADAKPPVDEHGNPVEHDNPPPAAKPEPQEA